MSIANLYIEGKLDFQVLNPIFRGFPLLQRGGTKNSLKPRALTERKDSKVDSGYLRDRDFDFKPPIDLLKPTVDYEDGGVPIGWRWCRHEIENYLIDPAIVSEAMAWPIPKIEDAIREAAKIIRHYEAARWTIGIVRRELPPHYNLETRPPSLKGNDIALPAIEILGSCEWALTNIGEHRTRIAEKANPHTVRTSLNEFTAFFDDTFIADVNNILLWFSGKDIMAGMANWLVAQNYENPGAFRASLRDWIIDNPERTLELLPEWNCLIEILRT